MSSTSQLEKIKNNIEQERKFDYATGRFDIKDIEHLVREVERLEKENEKLKKPWTGVEFLTG